MELLPPILFRGLAFAIVAAVSAAGYPGPAQAQELRRVSGQVLAQQDSTPLPAVLVTALGTGRRTETDAAGRFVLPGLPAGAIRLSFERTGMDPDTITLLPGRDTVTVYLRVRPHLLGAVMVEAAVVARERFELEAQTSTVSFDRAELAAAPSVGDPDVQRVAQLLPGTVARNDFSTGLNVRGGEADQNLIRLDGITVFNPAHLGGVFTVFDAGAVDRVDIITGAFPAEFGGRLSGVLDIGVRPGRPAHHATLGLSVLSGRTLLEGPVPGTGATYLVAGRRTYVDQILGGIGEDDFGYYFGDVLGKVQAPLPGGGSVSATGYWGRDRLHFPWRQANEEQDRVDFFSVWGNRLAGITIRQPFGRVTVEQRASVSTFFVDLEYTGGYLEAENVARVASVQTMLEVNAGGGHRIRLGGGYESYNFRMDVDRNQIDQRLQNLRSRPWIGSFFVENQWQPFQSLMLRPGMRVERIGGGADTTVVSPRISGKLFVTRDLAVTASAGRYFQAIHSIRDQELPVVLVDTWVGSDATTPVSRAHHLVLGVERWFRGGVSLTVEGYGKRFDRLAMHNPGDDPAVEGDELIPADGGAHGLEVLLRRHAGPVSGWIAYSYAWTIRHTETQRFHPAHDRRHTLNIVAQSPGPLGSQMGVRWGYGSPLPYTGFEGQWIHRRYNVSQHGFFAGIRDVVEGGINEERFPAYSRLDVSFQWSARWLGGIWRPYLHVVNLYNRRNVFVYMFDYSTSPATRSGYSQLPILPTIGVEVEF